MELRDYLAIRRAYNLVRQSMPTDARLTFVELAILCRMDVLDRPMNTSEIAEYQSALRPTMTHRTKHLAELGLIERSKGSTDRRNVVCAITEEGKALIRDIGSQICVVLRSGSVLTRTSPERILHYVNAMGALVCMSSDLVILGITQAPECICTVSDLVSTLGLLQPTVSMAVSTLESEGMVYRGSSKESAARSAGIALTSKGMVRSDELVDGIHAMVVHRRTS